MPDHAAFMRRALDLARRGWGSVQPNPLVGAVVVRDGEVIGTGYHAEYGGPHAEVHALREAGESARGATLYITLEPCAHTGKTPPCTDAIIAAGVGEVVYAVADPDPRAAGGADRLRRAGIRVTAGIEREAARTLNAAFFHRHEQRTAFVAVKLAVSLDGRIAEGAGRRTDLTGVPARAAVHYLRSGYDAIVIGTRTALVDDPLLTVRDAPVRVQPARVVLDTHARLPLTSRLVATAAASRVCVVCACDAPADRVAALEDAGVRVLRVPRDGERLDLAAACTTLAADGVSSLFVEGGGILASALIARDLVHRVHLFIAPVFLGTAGVPGFELPRPPGSSWRRVELEQLGDDALLTFDAVAAAAA